MVENRKPESGNRNGASGTSDMDGTAARVAESEAEAERINGGLRADPPSAGGRGTTARQGTEEVSVNSFRFHRGTEAADGEGESGRILQHGHFITVGQRGFWDEDLGAELEGFSEGGVDIVHLDEELREAALCGRRRPDAAVD